MSYFEKEKRDEQVKVTLCHHLLTKCPHVWLGGELVVSQTLQQNAVDANKEERENDMEENKGDGDENMRLQLLQMEDDIVLWSEEGGV